jgi:hypothetical protein
MSEINALPVGVNQSLPGRCSQTLAPPTAPVLVLVQVIPASNTLTLDVATLPVAVAAATAASLRGHLLTAALSTESLTVPSTTGGSDGQLPPSDLAVVKQ